MEKFKLMLTSDLKLYVANGTALTVSLTDVEMQLKITLLAITILYTLHKWYTFNNEQKNKK